MLIRPPIRSQDIHGAGHFHAPRGSRIHNGIDMACYAGSEVLSICDGTITKSGRPYYIASPQTDKEKAKNELRYVEVTDSDNLRFRYFYVGLHFSISVGDVVKAGDDIGIVQHLGNVFPGITNHVHFEIKNEDDEHLDPTPFL